MQNYSKIFIMASLAFSSQAVIAAPAASEMEFEKRAGDTNVCLSTLTGSPTTGGIRQVANDIGGRASSKLKGREHELFARSAPWLPSCRKLPSTTSWAKCTACQDVADGVYLAAVAGCTEGSLLCAVFEPYCEAACVAVASYSLYSAYQQCYCLHADCSDTKKAAASGLEAPPPTINLDGAVMRLQTTPALGQAFGVNGWSNQGKPYICDNNISLPPPSSGGGTATIVVPPFEPTP